MVKEAIKENMVGTSVRVPREILDRLESVASRSRWSKGEIHRQALEFYLSILEKGHFLAPLLLAGVVDGQVDPKAAEDVILATMKRIEPGAERGSLVGFRELRPACSMSEIAFHDSVLSLARSGRLSLHRHDYPQSLSDDVKAKELFLDGATYYVGCAIRQ